MAIWIAVAGLPPSLEILPTVLYVRHAHLLRPPVGPSLPKPLVGIDRSSLAGLNVQVDADTCSAADIVELMIDPLFDVAPPEAEVFTDPESQWAFASVAPGIDGGHRHTEVLGELVDGQQPIWGFHALILRLDPFNTMSEPLSIPSLGCPPLRQAGGVRLGRQLWAFRPTAVLVPAEAESG
jgi:hypothetical protein